MWNVLDTWHTPGIIAIVVLVALSTINKTWETIVTITLGLAIVGVCVYAAVLVVRYTRQNELRNQKNYGSGPRW
jgi:uncharacterized membrane protein YdjX (TVP38/TMEM64 family)